MKLFIPATAVLVAACAFLSALPAVDAQVSCPGVTLKVPRVAKTCRSVTLTARVTNGGTTDIRNGGLALTSPAGVELVKTSTFPKQRGDLLRDEEAGLSHLGGHQPGPGQNLDD